MDIFFTDIWTLKLTFVAFFNKVKYGLIKIYKLFFLWILSYFLEFFLNNWKNSAYFFGLNFSMEFRKQKLFAPIYVYNNNTYFISFFFLISDSVTADGLAIAHSRESSVVSGIFSMSPKCNNR